jgi:predicted permease
MKNFFQDMRFAIRMLGKSPGFTLVAILTLALGIGANTAIFSVIDSLLLHPHGIAHPDRLAVVRARYEKLNLKSIVISAPDFGFVRDNKQVFAASAIELGGSFNYTGSDQPQRLRGSQVTAQWFDVFEARPMLGRVFTPEEDQPNANHEVVLAYGTWKSFLGGDPGIIDRNIQLNQISYFNENYFCVARLQGGVSLSNAAAYLALTTQRVDDDPRTQGFPRSSGWAMFAVPFTTFVYGDLRTPLFILLGAVGFVLLIACSNVAGLLLARATGRMKEFAIRTALGASPWRLAGQALTESLVLAVIGMILALMIANGAIRVLLALSPENIATGVVVSIDRYVLLFSVLMAGLSAVIFGAAPAWQIALTDPQRNLQQGRGAGGGSRGGHRFRDLLVVGELALALVLLASAGVFLKSLGHLRDVDVGFRTHGLATAAIALPQQQYDTDAKQVAFLRSALDHLATTPGVESAAAGSPIPFSGFGGSSSFYIEGRVSPPGDPGPHGDIRGISPWYFEAMGIRLMRGRVFTDQDNKDAQPVMVIDENLARLYWPNQDAVGQHLRLDPKQPWATIVGIVYPVRHSQVVGEEASSIGVEGANKGVFYYSLYQTPSTNVFLMARTRGDVAPAGTAISDAVHAVDPGQPVFDVKTMDQRVALSLGPRRSAVTLLTIFAVMALGLSAVGLFGLVRYSVAQRTQEIGVRMALGASRRDVLGMVLREGLRLALGGVVGGLLAAFALTRVLASLLYGVSATDPLTFGGMALLLTLVALFASWIPARRATRVDPLVALRYE